MCFSALINEGSQQVTEIAGFSLSGFVKLPTGDWRSNSYYQDCIRIIKNNIDNIRVTVLSSLVLFNIKLVHFPAD